MSEIQEPLAEKIATALRKRILTGELSANTRLLESDIAEEMGTSRAPVREALRQLGGEGLVVSQGRRGTVVAKFSLRDVEEIYVLRALLEGYAVGWLAENAKPQDIEALRNITFQMDDAAQNNDYETIAGLNVQFHRYMIERTGHRRLAGLWLEMNRQVRMIMLTVTQFYPSLQGLGEYHRQVVDAIASGDRNRAESVIKEHILGTGDNLVQKLQKGGINALL